MVHAKIPFPKWQFTGASAGRESWPGKVLTNEGDLEEWRSKLSFEFANKVPGREVSLEVYRRKGLEVLKGEHAYLVVEIGPEIAEATSVPDQDLLLEYLRLRGDEIRGRKA